MELKPYVEEPLSIVAVSNLRCLDLRPRIRHDFFLLNREAVDEYWKTLEYCYAAAHQIAAKHAFPGSVVPEVCAWCSVCQVFLVPPLSPGYDHFTRRHNQKFHHVQIILNIVLYHL